MKISVTVKPNSKREYVEKRATLLDGETFFVAVKEPPLEGRANTAVIKALASYFDVPVSAVKVKIGTKSKNKVIEIQEK